MNNNIELLAPAGSIQALKAAVFNGGDAVYLGGYKFGARHYASNFSIEELKEAIEFCHIHNVRVYVTVNTLIHNREIKEFLDYMYTLYELDVDAVIVQDIGMINLIREYLPDFEVHTSTQLTIHNKEGIELLKDMGLERAVLAREMSIEEIEDIKSKTEMELEVFVHGALCMCYSGQCLMSSMIGGRSGNRGKCAQPCRLKYSLVDMQYGSLVPGGENTYLLSPKDLNTIDHVKELIDANVDSLKLEGRMKKPEYVATVVGEYRKAIDSISDRKKFDHKLGNERLTQIFNRGFTEGHLFGTSKLVDFNKPGNRGLYIGEVLDFNKKNKRVKIKLNKELNKGDGIEFISDKSRDKPLGTQVGDIYMENKKLSTAKKGMVIEIPFKQEIRKAKVFKTMDKQLLEVAKASYDRKAGEIPISAQITAMLGDTIKVYIWDSLGNDVFVEGEYIIEEARNKALEEDRLVKQISKLGDTEFKFMDINVTMDDNIAMPIGEINSVRRLAVEKLNQIRGDRNKRSNIRRESFEFTGTNRSDRTKLIPSVDSVSSLRALLDTEADIVYYRDINTLSDALELTRKNNIKLIPSLDRITSDKENEFIIEQLKDLGIKTVLVGNLGQMRAVKNMGIEVYTDFGINTFNSPTVDALGKLGATRVTLSPELNNHEIKDIASSTELPIEMLGYGRVEMMVTKYCPKKEITGCKNCGDSDKYYGYGLEDRKKVIFPIKMDNQCRTIILNSKTNVLIDNICEIDENHINFLRLQFTNESKDEIIYIMKMYSKYIDNIDNRDLRKQIANEVITKYKEDNNYTKGHYLRGVD